MPAKLQFSTSSSNFINSAPRRYLENARRNKRILKDGILHRERRQQPWLLILLLLPVLGSLTGAGQLSAQVVNQPLRPLASPTPYAAPIQQPGMPLPGGQSTYYPPPASSSFSPAQTNYAPATNYLKNSAAFRQEIMRMEINVVRGAQSLPITQVPRVQKGDTIKMKLLDESVGGIRPSDSFWDWTFLVAFVNPNRRALAAGEEGGKKGGAVSQEVRFKKTGWYKQYSFAVPYDAQPVFFLYPKPNYRSKILKVVTRNYNEVRKLGDKTIEIAGAYSQISSFLNELQFVMGQSQQSRYYNSPGYGTTTGTQPYGTNYGTTYGTTTGVYNPYGTVYGTTNPYSPYTPTNPLTATNQLKPPEIPFNYNLFVERTVERLARSFNLQLPSCWGNGAGGYGGGSSYGSTYGSPSYGSTYGSTYSPPSYGTTYGSTYGMTTGNQPNFGYVVSQELFSRAQCVAKNIRIEDFDLSVASMLQQGGIMAATYLRDKYPQFAYWINLAAVAIDFIVKVFQKAALKIVPTLVQTSEAGGQFSAGSASGQQLSYALQNGVIAPYSPNGTAPASPPLSAKPAAVQATKIALYAESQPDTSGFVTAYPIVVHKWQAEPDPEVISIPPPVLAEPCLRAGVNLLKNTAIGEEPEADTFTKDFKLTMSGGNGFKKEFPLRKNTGLGGWELTLTKEDLNSFPKIQMTLESQITGVRGFNEIKSPLFVLPLALGGSYEIAPESQKAFAVGGKRIISIRNPLGGCQCLQTIIYKPSFGGQFVYEANAKDRGNQLQYSPDGREVFFEIDAGSFQPGAGQLTLMTYGGEQTNLNLKLYPLPPNVANVRMARGDNQAVITGDRLEQLQFVKINGRRATVVGNNVTNNTALSPGPNGNPNYQPSTVQLPGNQPPGSQPSINRSPNNQPPNSYPNQNGGNGSRSGYPPPDGGANSYGAVPAGSYPNPANSNPVSGQPIGSNSNPVGGTGSNPNTPAGSSSSPSAPNQAGPPRLLRNPDGSNAPPIANMPSATVPAAVPAAGVSPVPVGSSNPNPLPVVSPVPGSSAALAAPIINPAASSASTLSQARVTAATLAPNERLVVFDDPLARLAETAISLELGLEDDRTLPLIKTYPALPARPAIITGDSREIEGQINLSGRKLQPSFPLFDSFSARVLPIETSELTLTVRNALTDYDFRPENLTVETRLENARAATGGPGNYGSGGAVYGGGFSTAVSAETAKATFEVLDWKNLRVTVRIDEPLKKLLGGRRLQFRIRDRERGDSDWYSIRQTFVRTAQIEAVACSDETDGQCEMTGTNLDYIGQISIDGGKTWVPGGAETLQVRAAENGRQQMSIPLYAHRKLLAVRLRDYPALDLPIEGDYKFTNTVKAAKKTAEKPSAQPVTPVPNRSPAPPPNGVPVKPASSQPTVPQKASNPPPGQEKPRAAAIKPLKDKAPIRP